MRKLFLLLAIMTASAGAQVQSLEMYFEGVGCVPCVESMPARAQRIRGVESARADAEKGLLTVRFAAQNRVRVEQIRDLIEQDGTKATKAVVEVIGTVVEEAGVWLLKIPQHALPLELSSRPGTIGADVRVRGVIEQLKPAPGARLRLKIVPQP